MFWRCLFLSAVFVQSACAQIYDLSLSHFPASIQTITAADPNISAAAIDTLRYLTWLPARSNHRIISGQYMGAPACCSAQEDPAFGDTNYVQALTTASGKTLGLMAGDYLDYNAASPGTPVSYTILNGFLAGYSAAGSLIVVSYHANNPWTGGDFGDKTCPGPLTDITDQTKSVGMAWRAQLDAVAAGLSSLQTSGVVVLWRPFLEANITAFWWGACLPTQAQFRAVWLDMFNYFTSVKGLHNLLWVYSADNSPTTQLLLYPGSDVVDVIGIDDYHLQHEYPDYFSMRATGKPVEYTERGPQVIDGTSQVFVGFIHDTAYKFPMVGYFMAYIAGNAIVNNPGASALMNDPNTANQNDVSAAMTCIRSSGTIAAKFACAIN